jgi:hypothetical protein
MRIQKDLGSSSTYLLAIEEPRRGFRQGMGRFKGLLDDPLSSPDHLSHQLSHSRAHLRHTGRGE